MTLQAVGIVLGRAMVVALVATLSFPSQRPTLGLLVPHLSAVIALSSELVVVLLVGARTR